MKNDLQKATCLQHLGRTVDGSATGVAQHQDQTRSSSQLISAIATF